MIGYDQGRNPHTAEPVGDPVAHTPPDEVDRIARQAGRAARGLAGLPPKRRAALLRSVAAALAAAEDELVPLADAETGLGTARLYGELLRTTVQLELFAEVMEEGSILEAIIDTADEHAMPVPRPDLRRMLVPIGPVAVFAASNFPFAFSVAGGDTASALAAGCPVVVKAHPGHPGLSARCHEIVAAALAGAPDGTFAMVHGLDAGRALVSHPSIAAVGFTGSLAAGRALAGLAAARPDPIPFYGEMGSLNPAVVTPAAVAARGAEIVRGFVGSYLLGSGQFCTKPGLLFLPRGHGLDGALVAAAAAAGLGPLLNERIRDGFRRTAAAIAATPGVRTMADPDESTMEPVGYRVSPSLFAVSSADLAARAGSLLEECFGPAALVVEYGSFADLRSALGAVPGSLTATLHAEPDVDAELIDELVDRFAGRAGRIIWGGWPTGVAVTWAQHHGGPWPATTAPLHTSVGVTAVRRFQRPVAYQNLPDAFLPDALKAANPLGIPRRVNGVLQQPRRRGA